MAISFVNVGTIALVGSGDLIPGIPASIANNDILICTLHQRENVVSTITAGWTLKVSGNGDTINRLSVWWKRTTGSESAPTITHLAGDSSIAAITAWRGAVTSGDPFDVVGTVQNNAGSPISTTSVTTVTNNAMVLHSFGSADNNTWGTYTGVPTTQVFQQANTTGADDSLAMTYGVKTPAGATGAAGATQATLGPDTGVSVQYALKPEPPPAGVANSLAMMGCGI